MASNEQSVTLLRRNKQAQVDALNSLGFSLTEGARASAFPELTKWSAGLLDVTIAANRIRDNKKFFFTLEEWQSLSATEQGLFILRGLRIRACATSFIIAAEDINSKAWGGSVSVANAHNHKTKRDNYSYWDAWKETNYVLDAYADKTANGVIGAPAAEAAVAYKAFTEDADGLEDSSQWCLPTLAQLTVMFRFRTEINAIITAVWASDFCLSTTASYWTCQQYDTSNAYRMSFDSGSAWTDGKTSLKTVRPICLD
jgi:hypothetical protein